MYSLFKSVIINGNYELVNLLKKIDVQWIQGSLTDDERNELIQLAQDKANSQNSLDLYSKVAELDKRVKALEELNLVDEDQAENGTTENEPTEGETDEGEVTEGETTEKEPEVTYPDFEVGKWYYKGDIISFEGINYICVAPEGTVCVWNPKDYPAYWEVFGEDAENDVPVEETENTVEEEATE